jgi:hypothetical protein
MVLDCPGQLRKSFCPGCHRHIQHCAKKAIHASGSLSGREGLKVGEIVDCSGNTRSTSPQGGENMPQFKESDSKDN